jgi:hypothetical protein
LSPAVLAKLGVTGEVPCESTFRRTIKKNRRQRSGPHPRRLDRAARRESEGNPGDRGRRQVLARLGHRRGSVSAPARRVHTYQRNGPRTTQRRCQDERDTHVLNASGQHRTAWSARHGRRSALPERPREIPCRLVEQRGAHYLLTVKGNQPTLVVSAFVELTEHDRHLEWGRTS